MPLESQLERLNVSDAGRVRGKVFADRFHSRILKTVLEAKQCGQYVVNNARKHAKQTGESIRSG